MSLIPNPLMCSAWLRPSQVRWRKDPDEQISQPKGTTIWQTCLFYIVRERRYDAGEIPSGFASSRATKDVCILDRLFQKVDTDLTDR